MPNLEEYYIAISGNPNVGKSTIFNNLTGMKQHTGNWPGKTVANAQGAYRHKNQTYMLVDIPGTYSLMASSVEEEIARDYICFGEPDATIVVMDATCIERNLNLVLQTIEITDRVVVCVNLIDQAEIKGIKVDLEKLSQLLGTPVVGTSARRGKGLKELVEAVAEVCVTPCKVHPPRYNDKIEQELSKLVPEVERLCCGRINARFAAIKLLEPEDTIKQKIDEHLQKDVLEDETLAALIEESLENLKGMGDIRDTIVLDIMHQSEIIYNACVSLTKENYNKNDRRLDKILTSKRTGIPVMILLLSLILFITISGANYPSQWLSNGLFWIEGQLSALLMGMGAPAWVNGLFVEGMFRTLAWVVSVMLPPMAIFFPLFTLLEDSGYLPRIAFNLDKFFKKACAHGKQALTMCMGFGCNACGVVGARIIDSPRERMIAILTNNFVPCNGRFPTLIAIIMMFFTAGLFGAFKSVVSTLILTAIIVLGVCATLLVSKLLSKTLLKGMPSSFVLELPPYRRPQIGKVIVRSIFDRTLFVLGRAVCLAAPAGLLIWAMANVNIDGISILAHCTGFLDPFARLFGMDGVILMAFILGFPANEIVVPIIIMSYMSTGALLDMDNLSALQSLLVQNGWTWVTAVCTSLFVLMHFPCGTTCLTIKKETGSFKWAGVAFALPTVIGLGCCFIVSTLAKIMGWG